MADQSKQDVGRSFKRQRKRAAKAAKKPQFKLVIMHKYRLEVIGEIYSLKISDFDIREISNWGRVFFVFKSENIAVSSEAQLVRLVNASTEQLFMAI